MGDAYAKMGRQNPSLHLNRGMAAKYIEDYELALRSFQAAHAIGAPSAASEGRKVFELVQRLAGSVERRCDVKVKHVRELIADMKNNEQRTLKALQAGKQEHVPLLCRVISIIDRQEDVPVILMCCDAHGDFFALSVYNTQLALLADNVTPMRTVLQIQKPKFRQNSVCGLGGKDCSYPSVRVAHPGELSILGGGSLVGVATQSKFSAGAKINTAAATPEDVAQSVSVSVATSEAGETSRIEPEKKAHERWIEQEDAKEAKRKAKEARANAEARARARAKGKEKKKASVKQETVQEDEVGSGEEDGLVMQQMEQLAPLTETQAGGEEKEENDHEKLVRIRRKLSCSTADCTSPLLSLCTEDDLESMDLHILGHDDDAEEDKASEACESVTSASRTSEPDDIADKENAKVVDNITAGRNAVPEKEKIRWVDMVDSDSDFGESLPWPTVVPTQRNLQLQFLV